MLIVPFLDSIINTYSCNIHSYLICIFQVTNSMAGVTKAMDAAMKSMNLEKISTLMDKFESQFEDLDVQSSYMENAMSQTTTTTVPQGDVDNLLQQVADEAGYDILGPFEYSLVNIKVLFIFFLVVVHNPNIMINK